MAVRHGVRHDGRGQPGAFAGGTMLFCGALLGTVLLDTGPLAGAAMAQDRPVTAPIDTVNGRARPDYDAVGIPLGGFTLLPEVALGAIYDSNLYRTATAKRADLFGQIQPKITLRSLSPRYPLTLAAGATIRRYASVKTENSEQYELSAVGAAEVAAGTVVKADGGHARLLEPRGTAGDLFIGGRPIEYDVLRAAASITRDVGRFAVQAGGDVARYDYARARINGTMLDQSFRDYRTRGGFVQAAYSFGPAIATFVRGGISRSRYPHFAAPDRGSKGYSVLAGVQLGLGNLVSGSAAIGYLHEDFNDPQFRTIAGFNYDVALTWNPTPLLAVNATGARSIQRSPFITSGGGLQTTMALRVDYELLRQVILTPELRYSRQSFRGPDRSDRYRSARFGGRYLVNRTVSMVASVSYGRQSSAGAGARDFNNIGAILGVTLHR